MQPLNLNEAAKLCHKSKSTVLEAIRSGRLSASRNDKNEWQIDPAELFRVYPYKVENEQSNSKKVERENRNRTDENLKEILENERKEREREREQMQATIEDLRKRLDEEAQERRKLTKLLTHQTEQKKENTLFKRIFSRSRHI
jgi:molecular chaperone GrpE (heat shock protein)